MAKGKARRAAIADSCANLYKAWMVYNVDIVNGCVLVYADTRPKAKKRALDSCFEWDSDDWNYLRTNRQPAWDLPDDDPPPFMIVEKNADLKNGLPEFYE